MKKVIIYILLLAMPVAAFCQSTPNYVPSVKIDYLEKSKKQKTTAWVLLGGGLGVSIVGASIGINQAANDLANIFVTGEQQSSSTGAVLFFAGGAAMLGSIPLFIASGKNKRNSIAASAGLKIEKLSLIHRNSFVQNSYPALSVKFNLR